MGFFLSHTLTIRTAHAVICFPAAGMSKWFPPWVWRWGWLTLSPSLCNFLFLLYLSLSPSLSVPVFRVCLSLSTSLCMSLSASLCLCFSLCLSVCLSLSLSLSPCLCLPLSLSLSPCLCLCLPLSPFGCLPSSFTVSCVRGYFAWPRISLFKLGTELFSLLSYGEDVAATLPCDPAGMWGALHLSPPSLGLGSPPGQVASSTWVAGCTSSCFSSNIGSGAGQSWKWPHAAAVLSCPFLLLSTFVRFEDSKICPTILWQSWCLSHHWEVIPFLLLASQHHFLASLGSFSFVHQLPPVQLLLIIHVYFHYWGVLNFICSLFFLLTGCAVL